MPVPWLPVDLYGTAERMLRAGPPVVRQASVAQAPTAQASGGRVEVDDELVVTSELNRYDPITDVFTFERGVVARYGPTTVRAERLVVDRKNMRATASGNVRVEDPEADLSADNLDFTWDPLKRSGTAQNVRARIANVNVSARQANITPLQYELLDVAGTACSQRTPLYEIRTRRLVVTPGRSGRAERPSIFIRGTKLLSLPDRTFNLDRRTEGFQFPALSYRRDGKLGVSWNSGFLVDNQTNLALNVGAFPNVRPGYGATLTRSFLPVAQATDILTPNSELRERFRFGFLENIRITSPNTERNYLRNVRRSVSVASLWNQGAVSQRQDVNFSKPFEITGELGGSFMETGGYIAQTRLQTIQRVGEAVHTRVVLNGSALLPSVRIAPRLNTLVRFDTSTFLGRNTYGWVRGLAGVSYQPLRQLTLSAAAFHSAESGKPLFDEVDPLYAKDGYVWRADLNLGTATRAGYMMKWDRRLGDFDREYYFSQVVGCLEPFVLYRRYPGEYNLGIRFRLDEFYDVLRRREFKRTKPTKTTYIPPEPSPPKE
ncbi:MAG: hypothetical protein ACO1SV_16135 [Fimbriimonas sp.]